MTIIENNIEKPGLTGYIKQYEYEAILFVYLLARFIFKNILGLAKYFTAQPVFGPSNTLNIALGAMVVLAVCICLASVFGQLISKNGKDFEDAGLVLVALFFACPTTLPFLFNTNNLSGTQMLYPFALFVFSVYLIGKPVVEWLVPIICAAYIIPALFSTDIFFTNLLKTSILYVPLILLFLFFDLMNKKVSANNTLKAGNKKEVCTKNKNSGPDITIFINSFIVSAGSFVYAINSGKFYFENLYNVEQKADRFLMFCLLITLPLLIVFGAVLIRAYKNNYSKPVLLIYLCSTVLLFPLYQKNYYGLWVPFLTISLSFVVFFGILKKNPAILSAVKTISEFFLKRKLLFFFVLIAMASLSNTSMIYVSSFLLNIFSHILY